MPRLIKWYAKVAYPTTDDRYERQTTSVLAYTMDEAKVTILRAYPACSYILYVYPA
jgi:hypothetical protein